MKPLLESANEVLDGLIAEAGKKQDWRTQDNLRDETIQKRIDQARATQDELYEKYNEGEQLLHRDLMASEPQRGLFEDWQTAVDKYKHEQAKELHNKLAATYDSKQKQIADELDELQKDIKKAKNYVRDATCEKEQCLRFKLGDVPDDDSTHAYLHALRYLLNQTSQTLAKRGSVEEPHLAFHIDTEDKRVLCIPKNDADDQVNARYLQRMKALLNHTIAPKLKDFTE